MSETLPPAVLDLIVNTSEWLEALQTAIAGLSELNVAIEESVDATRIMAEQITAAGEEISVSMEAASVTVEAAAEASATAFEGMAAAADAAAAQIDEATASMAASASREEEAAVAAGSGIGGAFAIAAAAIVAVSAAGVEQATKFQESTTRLVTSANESDAAIAQVRDGLLNMAGQVGYSAQQLSQGMYVVESAGYHAADGLTVMKAAAEGAKDENADLTQVANAVTDVLTDYHLKASDAATVTSQMVEAISFGKTNFQDFSRSMSNVLPIASAVGLSFGDVASVEAEMTAHGTTAQRASQDVANAIRSLIAPTNAMSKEMTALGISADDVSSHLSSDGLGGTLEWLSQVADKNSAALGQTAPEAMRKLVGTAPGLQAILETTGENFGNLSTAINAVSHASADGQGNVAGFAEVQKTLAQQVSQAKAAIDALLIRIGEALLPILTQAMSYVAKFAETLSQDFDKVTQAGSKLSSAVNLKPLGDAFVTVGKIITQDVFPAAKNLAEVFGPVLIGHFNMLMGVLGPVMDLFKGLAEAFKGVTDFMAQHATIFQAITVGILAIVAAMKAFSIIMGVMDVAVAIATADWTAFDVALDANPIMLIILAIIGLVAGIIYLWNNSKGFHDFFVNLWNDIVGAVKDAISFFESLGSKIGEGFSAIGSALGTAKDAVVGFVSGVIDWIKDLPHKAGEALSNLGSLIANVAKDAWNHFMDALKEGGEAVLNFFKNLPYEIGFAIGFLAGTLARAAVDAAKSFWNAIVTGFNATVEFFKNLPHMIMQGLSNAGTWLVKTGTDLIHGLVTSINNAATAVWDWVTNLPHQIGVLVAEAGLWLVNTGLKLIRGLETGIVNEAMYIWVWLQNLPNNILTWLTNASNWLDQKGHDIIEGLKNGIVNAATAVWDWLKALPSNFLHWLGDAGNWLVSTGKDIIYGLWDGIKSAASWLWNQISSFASGIIDGFKAAFDSHSPSKRMADEVGYHLSTGIAQGMMNGLPAIHSAISSIAGAVTGANYGGTQGAGLGLPTGLAGAAAGGGILVINNNISGSVVSEKQIQQINQTQTLRYNFRNPTNGLSLFGRGSA